MATSTTTEPGFIRRIMSAVTSFGAAAPGMSTPPMTTSASVTWRSIAVRVEYTVSNGRPN